MIPELEKEFSTTCRLLLGSELLGTLDDYGKWLGRHVPLPHLSKSALSGKDVWLPPPLSFRRTYFTTKRVISMEEMDLVNSSPFSAGEIANSSPADIKNKFIKPLVYVCGNFRYQEHQNVEKCSGAGGGVNLYYGEDVYLGVKNIGYSNYTLYCENMFGCHGCLHSKFSIHAYNSTNVTRCFEVEGCENSSDLLFCHNCEGTSNAILCFNAKNLRYAVGNVEVGPDEFARVKKILLDYAISELREKKMLNADIYDVGGLGR
ncbi:MAG: hypothetical protein HZB67_01710 [Candidatus Aenigmarchaeota archaeon]|nr:hypothetical protein [Candidatus Aenigmarchaeota archaeon]